MCVHLCAGDLVDLYISGWPYPELLQTCAGSGYCSSRWPAHHLKHTYLGSRSRFPHMHWSDGRLTEPWQGTWCCLPWTHSSEEWRQSNFVQYTARAKWTGHIFRYILDPYHPCLFVNQVENSVEFWLPEKAITDAFPSQLACHNLEKVHLDWLLNKHHVVLSNCYNG